MATKQAASSAPSEQLRAVIAARGLAANAVGVAAGICPTTVSRFLTRRRGLTSESFDAIALALGLKLVEGRGGLR